MAMEQYIIAIAMGIVTVGQVWNYNEMEKSKIKTGIFGGSFNPIHMGHLALANYLCEYNGLDEIWFLVSPHNRLKQQTDLWDDNLRLELVKLAIADYPNSGLPTSNSTCLVLPILIHTLDALHKAYPNREFTLIIGADNWLLFPRWYKAEEILKNHHVMIYPRPNFTIDPNNPSSFRAISRYSVIGSQFYFYQTGTGGRTRYTIFPASGSI